MEVYNYKKEHDDDDDFTLKVLIRVTHKQQEDPGD